MTRDEFLDRLVREFYAHIVLAFFKGFTVGLMFMTLVQVKWG